MAVIQVKNQLKIEFIEYGIANVSIIPVRIENSEKSEMVTQVLFGEHFEVIRETEKWAKIRMAYDGYEGWVDKKMIAPISRKIFKRLSENFNPVLPEITRKIYSKNNLVPITIVAGSVLPFYNGRFSFKFDKQVYKSSGKPKLNSKEIDRNIVLKNAMSYLNTPYLWGGRSPFGIDCSGFSQIVYKMNYIFIPRDAGQQVNHGVAVNFINEAKPGDLAFFDNDEGFIIHVGILTGDGRIIHSSGKVRMDLIDHNGIFNPDTRRYTHKLRVVKDIISFM